METNDSLKRSQEVERKIKKQSVKTNQMLMDFYCCSYLENNTLCLQNQNKSTNVWNLPEHHLQPRIRTFSMNTTMVFMESEP